MRIQLPVHLVKQATALATSTTEAEYNALLDVMGEVIALQTLLEFLAKTISYD
jgi:hypothetical protein